MRGELGATQQWLAARVGVSQQTIARWERNSEVPTKYLRDLAVALGCTISDLVEGAEPRSWLARYAAQRAGGSKQERDDSEIQFGTLRLRFIPSTRELLNPKPNDETAWPRPFEREYAITKGERRRLSLRLDDRGDYFPSWFTLETLDNRMVFVNRAQLESLEMVHDDIEDTPPFAPVEIYEAVGDWRVQQVLEGHKSIDDFDHDDAPYSRMTLDTCFEFAEQIGGVERLLNSVNYVYAQTTDGREPDLFSDPNEETLDELSLLNMELDAMWTAKTHPVDDWLVELGAEGWMRSSLYRLGSLRVIEAPLLKYLAAAQRHFDDGEPIERQEEEDG